MTSAEREVQRDLSPIEHDGRCNPAEKSSDGEQRENGKYTRGT